MSPKVQTRAITFSGESIYVYVYTVYYTIKILKNVCIIPALLELNYKI
jgi:hypothetical protein